jgi:hypothetical protein
VACPESCSRVRCGSERLGHDELPSTRARSLVGGDLPLTIAEIAPERRADRKLTGVREGLPTIHPALYSSGCNPPMVRQPGGGDSRQHRAYSFSEAVALGTILNEEPGRAA